MPPDRPSKGKIIVFGILFWYPLAGVTYQFLHYLLGLRRLGWDVYYTEDSSRWLYDPKQRVSTGDATVNTSLRLRPRYPRTTSTASGRFAGHIQAVAATACRRTKC